MIQITLVSPNKRIIIIDGISCCEKDGYYTFTVPGWDECTVYGIESARRVIRGRLDAAVRNTLGITY